MTETPIAPLDFSGVIPAAFSNQIIEEAVQQSAVLQLANRVPMGTLINQMPVPKAFPKAGWVSVGGRKPYTDLKLDLEQMTAEEIAAVVAIPDAMLEDSSIALWNWVRPRLAEAIAIALDNTVLFGIDAPATFPAGGVLANSTVITGGADAVDTINQAMSTVEGQGIAVTGSAADLVVRGALRGVRDETGALLLGFTQADQYERPTLYGLPISYISMTPEGGATFFTGGWQNLIIGVRQDIRYLMDPNAVLADESGAVVISGFQDNVTALKVWARFACVIIHPVTQRMPEGAMPFAAADISGVVAASGAASPLAASATRASAQATGKKSRDSSE